MRMDYNPKHVTNWLTPWKGFLTGSLILTSISILVTTENELVFLGMVGFILAGIVLLFEGLLRQGEEIPFLTTVMMFVVGGGISVILAILGLAYIYFPVVIILIVLTYAPRGKFPKKFSRR